MGTFPEAPTEGRAGDLLEHLVARHTAEYEACFLQKLSAARGDQPAAPAASAGGAVTTEDLPDAATASAPAAKATSHKGRK